MSEWRRGEGTAVEGPLMGVSLDLPGWVAPALTSIGPLESDDARMGLVLDLARANVERSEGGPFAAAVFHRHSGELVAVGLNLVLATRAPVAHAEIVAIALAGARLGTYALDSGGADRAGDVLPAVRHVPRCRAVDRRQPSRVRRAR